MMELKKFDSDALNTEISNAIHKYIADGYHIDAKESVIDREKDKDCTFKAVLKKDVDGIECKTIITLNENKNDNSHTCKYHKVETVGDTKWSEETRSFSTNSVDFTKPKSINVPFIPNLKLETAKDDNLNKNKMSDSFTVSKKDLKKSLNAKRKHTSDDSTKNDSKTFNVKDNVKETNGYFDDDLMKLIHRIFYIV